MKRRFPLSSAPLVLAAGALLMSGCAAVGPDYHKPTAAYPAFRNTPATAPASASAPSRADWWQAFGDATLDRLETRALADNPGLAAAAARVESARACLGVARADRLPSASGDGTAILASEGATRTIPVPGHPLSYRTRGDSYDLGFGASYELDLWGRVRREIQSSAAQAAASEADARATRLALCADLAQTYFLYRELEAEASVETRSIAVQRDNLSILRARQRGGFATDLDIERARAEVATSQADAADLVRRREQAFDALALLAGTDPAELAPLVAHTRLPSPPRIPGGVPSEVLKRRPDVAAAEERLKAATADIGVAIADRYPTFQLTGAAGFDSLALRTLLQEPSRYWQLGPTLTGSLFDGGRGKARVAAARAEAKAALADYRSQCLRALGDVEDALVALRQESVRDEALRSALSSSRTAVQLANERYTHGLTNYLDVLDAQRSALQVERSLCEVQGARLSGTVQLIRALGGGWD